MLNKYENCSLTNESTCRSQLRCGAKYWINKFEHCGIRTKANYLYNDFKDLTQMCCGKCHCVVQGKLNPFPNKPWFSRVCNTSLWKTL